MDFILKVSRTIFGKKELMRRFGDVWVEAKHTDNEAAKRCSFFKVRRGKCAFFSAHSISYVAGF